MVGRRRIGFLTRSENHLYNVTAGLTGGATAVATLLPISAIVLALSLLNLEHVVFNLMGGFRDDIASANDSAYYVVVSLSIIASAIRRGGEF